MLFLILTKFSLHYSFKYCNLNDKSRVVAIVDYSRDYTVVNDVKYFFQLFSLLICQATYFNLLKSAK